MLARFLACHGPLTILPDGGLCADAQSPDIDIAFMTRSVALSAGVIVAVGGHYDLVDVDLAPYAREHHHGVVASAPDDIARVDPALPLIDL